MYGLLNALVEFWCFLYLVTLFRLLFRVVVCLCLRVSCLVIA